MGHRTKFAVGDRVTISEGRGTGVVLNSFWSDSGEENVPGHLPNPECQRYLVSTRFGVWSVPEEALKLKEKAQ